MKNLYDGLTLSNLYIDKGPYIRRGVFENGVPYYTGTYSPELNAYVNPTWFDENEEYNIGLPTVTIRPSGEGYVNAALEKAAPFIRDLLLSAAGVAGGIGSLSNLGANITRNGLETAVLKGTDLLQWTNPSKWLKTFEFGLGALRSPLGVEGVSMPGVLADAALYSGLGAEITDHSIDRYKDGANTGENISNALKTAMSIPLFSTLKGAVELKNVISKANELNKGQLLILKTLTNSDNVTDVVKKFRKAINASDFNTAKSLISSINREYEPAVVREYLYNKFPEIRNVYNRIASTDQTYKSHPTELISRIMDDLKSGLGLAFGNLVPNDMQVENIRKVAYNLGIDINDITANSKEFLDIAKILLEATNRNYTSPELTNMLSAILSGLFSSGAASQYRRILNTNRDFSENIKNQIRQALENNPIVPYSELLLPFYNNSTALTALSELTPLVQNFRQGNTIYKSAMNEKLLDYLIPSSKLRSLIEQALTVNNKASNYVFTPELLNLITNRALGKTSGIFKGMTSTDPLPDNYVRKALRLSENLLSDAEGARGTFASGNRNLFGTYVRDAKENAKLVLFERFANLTEKLAKTGSLNPTEYLQIQYYRLLIDKNDPRIASNIILDIRNGMSAEQSLKLHQLKNPMKSLILDMAENTNFSGFISAPHDMSIDSYPIWEKQALQGIKKGEALPMRTLLILDNYTGGGDNELINGLFFHPNNDFALFGKLDIAPELTRNMAQITPEERLTGKFSITSPQNNISTISFTPEGSTTATVLGDIRQKTVAEALQDYNQLRLTFYKKLRQENLYPGDAVMKENYDINGNAYKFMTPFTVPLNKGEYSPIPFRLSSGGPIVYKHLGWNKRK